LTASFDSKNWLLSSTTAVLGSSERDSNGKAPSHYFAICIYSADAFTLLTEKSLSVSLLKEAKQIQGTTQISTAGTVTLRRRRCAVAFKRRLDFL